jgi:archaeal flagellin FlaB
MKSNRKFTRNDAAFTGLEAAIVLIAFVVVAAVFSYVMLGAGFFTSQKSKEVVHTGVDQATSSIQTSGDVIAKGDGAVLTEVDLTLMLTAGNNPIDLNKLVVSYRDDATYAPNIWDGSANYPADAVWVASNQATADNMLEQFEKVRLTIDTTAQNIGVNTKFSLEVKPQAGAILPVSVTTPPAIADGVMILV